MAMRKDSARPARAVPHVVIVGGGFAGLEVARGLKDAACRVTLVDRVNHHLFQPLLYQVATAALSAGETPQPIRHILRNCANTTVLLDEMTSLDADRQRVMLEGAGPLDYDIMVLAIGATHGYFGHPEWARFAPGLKTLDDARRIRNQILLAFEHAEQSDNEVERRRLMTIAVVGGGPTGVELAGALAELARETLPREFRRIKPEQAEIILFEAGPQLLPQLPEDLARYAERALVKLGVKVRTGAPVQDVRADGLTADGSVVPAATVLWAAGVAAPPLGRWLGVPTDKAGRVVVQPDLSLAERPEVFVLGDAAACLDESGKPLPGLAQVAQQQGRHLGHALARHLDDGAPIPPFRYRERGSLATVGRNAAVAQFGRTRLRGFLAWLIWGIVHVFLLVGFENRMLVAIRWLWIYTTGQRSARLITRECHASEQQKSARQWQAHS